MLVEYLVQPRRTRRQQSLQKQEKQDLKAMQPHAFWAMEIGLQNAPSPTSDAIVSVFAPEVNRGPLGIVHVFPIAATPSPS